jgi:hypothetical protein
MILEAQFETVRQVHVAFDAYPQAAFGYVVDDDVDCRIVVMKDDLRRLVNPQAPACAPFHMQAFSRRRGHPGAETPALRLCSLAEHFLFSIFSGPNYCLSDNSKYTIRASAAERSFN